MLRLKIAASLLGLFLLMLFTACGGGSGSSSNGGSGSGGNGGSGGGGGTGGGGTGDAPTISTFTVSPTVAGPGQFVNFSWATTHATTFTVKPGINQDDQT